MKFLAFSDLHISNKNSKFRFTGKVNDLLNQQQNYISHVCDLAEAHDVDAVLFLGDWTDYPTLDTVTSTYSNRMISMLLDLNKPVIFIEGNHCIEDSKLNYTVLGAASELSSSDDIQGWFVTEISKIVVDRAVFHCVPYHADYKKLENDIARLNESIGEDKKAGIDRYNILLFHFPTTNAILDNGFESTNGVALTQDIISNFDVCLGGDFHKPQKLLGTDNAYYVGAPFDFNFGDHVDDRGTLLIELEGKEIDLQWLKNPFQVNIQKVDANDFMNMNDEKIKGHIFRIVGEVDPEKLVQLNSKKSLAYRVDMALAKKKKVESKGQIKTSRYYSKGNEVEYISQMLSDKQLDENTKKEIISIFQSVRG